MKTQKLSRFYDTSGFKHACYVYGYDSNSDYWKESEFIIMSDISLKEIELNSISDDFISLLEDLEKEKRLLIVYYFDNFLNLDYNGLCLKNYIKDDQIKTLACALFIEKWGYADNMNYVTGELRMKILANKYFGDDSIEYIY